VLRRELELVDRMKVARIGDRDPEHVVLERVRNHAEALEHVQGDGLGSLLADSAQREVDQRQLMPRGEHPRDPLAGCETLVDKRLRERAGRSCAAANGRDLVLGQQPGGDEKVRDELGIGIDAEGSWRKPAFGRQRLIAGSAGRSQIGWPLEFHARIPRTRYRQVPGVA
jgi:hypothetical protein